MAHEWHSARGTRHFCNPWVSSIIGDVTWLFLFCRHFDLHGSGLHAGIVFCLRAYFCVSGVPSRPSSYYTDCSSCERGDDARPPLKKKTWFYGTGYSLSLSESLGGIFSFFFFFKTNLYFRGEGTRAGPVVARTNYSYETRRLWSIVKNLPM